MRWWPLVGVAALAAALRWFRIDAQSLWYDEGISAHQLTRSFAEILSASALDTHPPLYYWTLKAWGETVGSSELGLRSLSATCGLLCVVLTFLIGRRVFGPLAGTLAAVLLAVSPLAVYYSQEVRMYAQVTAFGLLAVYAYTRRIHWLYAVAGLATLYSQYLGIALLGAVNLHALVWWRSRTRREWIAWLVANVVVALGFLPWLPTFVAQQTHALNESPRTPFGLLLETLRAYGGGLAHGDVFVVGGGLLVCLAVLGLVLSRDRPASSLAGLMWLVPLALVVTLGLRSGLFEVRYLVLSLPGLALLAGQGLVRVARRPWLASMLALVPIAPAALGLSAQYFDPSLARDDYRDLVATIKAQALPSDAVVLSAPNQVEVFSYYYHGPLPTLGLPQQRPIDVADTQQRLAAIKAQYGRIWLVDWAMPEADPGGFILNWLAANGFQASHAWYGSVQLSLIGFQAADVVTQHVDAALDNGVNLDAYRIGSRTVQPGQTVALTLVWRAAHGPTSDRWKVFTHLLDEHSNVVAQRDAEPLDGLRPTPTWAPGEQIEDNYGITIPETLTPGTYTLEIGMYSDQTRATFIDQGSNHLDLGPIQVT